MKILTISGSLRKDSYNRKVIQFINKTAEEAGHDVSEVDLAKLDIPVLNTDQKTNDSIEKLNNLVKEAKLVIISTPEYNRSIPGGFKNALDHLNGKTPFMDKVVMITGASTGGFGTVRAQLHLKEVLSAMGAIITPKPEIYIKDAAQVFGENDSIKDEKMKKELKELLDNSIALAEKI